MSRGERTCAFVAPVATAEAVTTVRSGQTGSRFGAGSLPSLYRAYPFCPSLQGMANTVSTPLSRAARHRQTLGDSSFFRFTPCATRRLAVCPQGLARHLSHRVPQGRGVFTTLPSKRRACPPRIPSCARQGPPAGLCGTALDLQMTLSAVPLERPKPPLLDGVQNALGQTRDSGQGRDPASRQGRRDLRRGHLVRG